MITIFSLVLYTTAVYINTPSPTPYYGIEVDVASFDSEVECLLYKALHQVDEDCFETVVQEQDSF